jgi:hypothetical protein
MYLLFNYYVHNLVRVSTGVSPDFQVIRILTTPLEYEVRVRNIFFLITLGSNVIFTCLVITSIFSHCE